MKEKLETFIVIIVILMLLVLVDTSGNSLFKMKPPQPVNEARTKIGNTTAVKNLQENMHKVYENFYSRQERVDKLLEKKPVNSN